jgi:hypothetical protein
MIEINNTSLGNDTLKKGWSQEETSTLFGEARLAGKEGRPIKRVFEKMATLTGRKPNSIRNYYYMKLKETNPEIRSSFVPFRGDEVEVLVENMLRGQAEGKSVRRIASEMGDGDKKAMLRYQNKFRSIMKNDPVYIQDMMHKLAKKGEISPGQFVIKKRMYKRQSFDEVVSELMRSIAALGKRGEAVIIALNDIVSLAVLSSKETTDDKALRVQNALLLSDVARLSSTKKQMDEELAQQYTKARELERRLKELESINRGFIRMAGMEKISGLTEYAAALENCLGETAFK